MDPPPSVWTGPHGDGPKLMWNVFCQIRQTRGWFVLRGFGAARRSFMGKEFRLPNTLAELFLWPGTAAASMSRACVTHRHGDVGLPQPTAELQKASHRALIRDDSPPRTGLLWERRESDGPAFQGKPLRQPLPTPAPSGSHLSRFLAAPGSQRSAEEATPARLRKRRSAGGLNRDLSRRKQSSGAVFSGSSRRSLTGTSLSAPVRPTCLGRRLNSGWPL